MSYTLKLRSILKGSKLALRGDTMLDYIHIIKSHIRQRITTAMRTL